MVVKRGIAVSLPLCAALPSIAVPEPFSIELTGDSNGVTLMARCTQGSIVKQQPAAHYPQAVLHEVPRIKTPLLLQEGEQAWSTTMRVEGPKFLPLRTFHDRDLFDQGSDPLIALVGSLSNLDAGERVSTRLYLQSLGPLWSQPHREHAHTTRTAEPNDTSYTCQTTPNGRIRTHRMGPLAQTEVPKSRQNTRHSTSSPACITALEPGDWRSPTKHSPSSHVETERPSIPP